MNKDEIYQYTKEKTCYAKIWSKCNSNVRVVCGYRTNLNKELEIMNRNLSAEALDLLIERKLGYQLNQWRHTAYPLGEDQFEKKWLYLKKHGFKVQLTHCKDVKFRHDCNKWLQFFTVVGMIEEIFEKYPDLKLFILGPGHEEFKFSEMFLESESNFYQFYMLQIQRCEKNSNIEYDSFWTTAHNSADFVFLLTLVQWCPL